MCKQSCGPGVTVCACVSVGWGPPLPPPPDTHRHTSAWRQNSISAIWVCVITCTAGPWEPEHRSRLNFPHHHLFSILRLPAGPGLCVLGRPQVSLGAPLRGLSRPAPTLGPDRCSVATHSADNQGAHGQRDRVAGSQAPVRARAPLGMQSRAGPAQACSGEWSESGLHALGKATPLLSSRAGAVLS